MCLPTQVKSLKWFKNSDILLLLLAIQCGPSEDNNLVLEESMDLKTESPITLCNILVINKHTQEQF